MDKVTAGVVRSVLRACGLVLVLALIMGSGVVWAEAPTAAPTLLLPPQGATGVSTAPRLTWSPVDGATKYYLKIYDNEALNGHIWAREYTGTVAEITGLQPNTHYWWRVVGFNTDGEGPWSEVHTFRTSSGATPPAAPVLISPPHGATDVPVPARLSWQPTPGAARYVLQLATSDGFGTLVWHRTYTATVGEVVGLAAATRYWWRVRGQNEAGDGRWSVAWSFTTGAASPPLSAPVLQAPSNGAAHVRQPVRLKWNAVQAAQGYVVQVATTDSFSTLAWSRSVTAPVAEVVGLQVNTRYFWRVKAFDATRHGPWSAAWSFTTVAGLPPAAGPRLVSPPHRATGVSLAPRLTWEAVEGANHYKLQIASNDGFGVLLWNKAYPVTAAQLPPLKPNSRHWWRVAAANEFGVGPWSEAWVFTTEGVAPPATAPSLLAPANGATGVTPPVLCSWTAVDHAAAYRLLLATNETFTAGVIEREVAGTRVSLPLAANTRYWWKAAAVNAGGRGPWSAKWSFTTGEPAPALPAPVLISPVSGALDVSVSPRLMWSPVDGATRYKLQVSRNAEFTGLVWQEHYTATVAELSHLPAGLKLYWRVLALNEHGPGPWSEVWNFTTVRQ